MITFNTQEELTRAQIEATEKKPIVIVTFKRKRSAQSIDLKSTFEPTGKKSELVAECWGDYNRLKIDRGKLSSSIARHVDEGATQIELKRLYDLIDSYGPRLAALFDRARYVEQYGHEPAERKENARAAVDIDSLKFQKQNLSKLRYKLRKRIQVGEAHPKTKNSKLVDWKIQLEQLDAEYYSLDQRIKRMEGK